MNCAWGKVHFEPTVCLAQSPRRGARRAAWQSGAPLGTGSAGLCGRERGGGVSKNVHGEHGEREESVSVQLTHVWACLGRWARGPRWSCAAASSQGSDRVSPAHMYDSPGGSRSRPERGWRRESERVCSTLLLHTFPYRVGCCAKGDLEDRHGRIVAEALGQCAHAQGLVLVEVQKARLANGVVERRKTPNGTVHPHVVHTQGLEAFK